LNLNLNHTFWGMRKALAYMIPQESGRIIAMSSMEGKLNKPTLSNYTSNKHAINGLVKVAAHEVGTLGITVNAILPGLVLTDMFTQPAAIKRPNTVEEVAAVALMLSRDEARNITGCLFPVDGGTMPY
ncbi:MAG: SDR family oxidoreductase, partial [Acidimicrobiales bacterium]|nr:SDR family oxidoreductase [Acidimicrobiales bacterium]